MKLREYSLRVIVFFLLMSSQFVFADIYKWVDGKGKVHYSDKRPELGDAKAVELKVNTYEQVDIDSSLTDTGSKVVMYSTSWCGYCKKARKYFKENNITYVEYDIEKSVRAKKEYENMGARGVPVILVGKKRMNGFSAGAFERLKRTSRQKT